MNNCKQIEARSAAHFSREIADIVGAPEAYRLYGVTLASNAAVKKNSYKAYELVISQLPHCVFIWIREISSKGKHHIHGIMKLKYNFDYLTLQDSKITTAPFKYDIHIDYSPLETKVQLKKWINYLYSDRPRYYYTVTCDPDNIRYKPPLPKTCISEVQQKIYYKSLKIPGLPDFYI